METVTKVMAELKKNGNAERIKAFAPHGAPKKMFGVSVADMKVIAKKIKGEQDLACELYETGNSDAMYLAGMVADGALMTKKQLDSWAKNANWRMISEYTVPGVATESKHAHDLAVKWIKSKKESVASTGWNTYVGIVTVTPDEEPDCPQSKPMKITWTLAPKGEGTTLVLERSEGPRSPRQPASRCEISLTTGSSLRSA